MIEVLQNQYRLPYRLLRLLAVLMAVAIFLQALGCLAAYLLMLDSQAAGMMAHLLMQQLSYYLLGCTFVILSLANVLIKRGVSQLKAIRLPALILTVSVAVASFLLIPRMDYLRDTALDAGMPVMLSPFANYFVILNSIVFLLLCAQIF
jgi:amino acid permease